MEFEIGMRSLFIECPNCNGKLKVIVESKPRKVLIAHETINPEDIFIKFPTIGEPNEWPLTKSQIAAWIDIFRGISVKNETMKARAWLIANPSRCKTAKGMNRFLVAWLSRAQNKGTGRPIEYGETVEQIAKRKSDFLALKQKMLEESDRLYGRK